MGTVWVSNRLHDVCQRWETSNLLVLPHLIQSKHITYSLVYLQIHESFYYLFYFLRAWESTNSLCYNQTVFHLYKFTRSTFLAPETVDLK